MQIICNIYTIFVSWQNRGHWQSLELWHMANHKFKKLNGNSKIERFKITVEHLARLQKFGKMCTLLRRKLYNTEICEEHVGLSLDLSNKVK